MVKAQSRTLIKRPLEQVFSFIVDDFIQNYPRWSPEVKSLRALTSGPLRPGWTGHQVRVDQGRRTETEFRVVTLEPGSRVSFRGIKDPFQIDYKFTPRDGHTELTFTFELAKLGFAMRPFEKLIRIAVQEGTDRTARNIKGLAETELEPASPTPPPR
ncbi:polyketide cyclase [Ectothiorhodospira haloalkaliphila]|uniref:Polyketide cyclase n=1 Tax=Ectothiorhodospira haloalkaliphila TaxID=421628 RepID=W8KUT0_9GAMM|nr:MULTISPECIES: SRPBCC family protein [Ectothiorhodospira]AHK79331.1 polyketide cyclase [Ectothiorhodospira haloalkaliphila]MCG5495429.1 SRPBCC family protein [Ectothiorhodospira variabilis]MCG5497766.1 SRPBCC family protein [Ectothiorhodospira variabilis]MCG5505027.1 SRPBCC family protein [Ectothiorhodospira variabilis]MCG5508184.1 SRPBCC family protein [Ectothiorhodospira variabilis]